MHPHLEVNLPQIYTAFFVFAFYGVMYWISAYWKAVSKFGMQMAVETESYFYTPEHVKVIRVHTFKKTKALNV